MKTRSGYWISGALIIVAIVGAVLWVSLSIANMTDRVEHFTRVGASESDSVRLDARKYVIYFEGTNADEYPPALTVSVQAEDGTEVPTPSYLTDLTYSFGGHEGSAQVTVTPPSEGEYTISVSDAYDGEAGAGVALGESLSQPLLRTIFGGILIAALFGLSGIALLATTIVRRHNARKPPGPVQPAVFAQPPPPYAQASPPTGQEAPYGRETPYGQSPAGPPPPPYGQTPSPGPPPDNEPPPPPSLWGSGSR